MTHTKQKKLKNEEKQITKSNLSKNKFLNLNQINRLQRIHMLFNKIQFIYSYIRR